MIKRQINLKKNILQICKMIIKFHFICYLYLFAISQRLHNYVALPKLKKSRYYIVAFLDSLIENLTIFVDCSTGGSGGIRTPVGLHPNGFQDRLVVTASIHFRIFAAHSLYQSAAFVSICF